VSLRHICAQITGRTLVKQYIALVRGHIDPPQGALSMPLALSSTDKPLGACAMEGRAAVTRYRVLGYFGHGNEHGDPCGHAEYSLLQLQIDHGRQHQIRLHMATIGHPVVFDVKYSTSNLQEDSRVCSRLFLHAAFVKCHLPPDGTEPLQVACRLPPQLRQALTTTLLRERSLEGALPSEARVLCECLLAPDVTEGSAAGDSPFEARLAVRRRDEFLRTFSFSKTEREEVVRILAKLPTAEDRSTAMLKFRVNGDRTTELIVCRFDKYVEELLKQKAEVAEKSEGAAKAEGADDSAPAANATSEEKPEREKPANLQEENGGYGPVSLHSEFVTCPACGSREKLDYVQFPALQIKLSCRVTAAPMAEPLARLMASAAQHEAAEHAAEMRPPPPPQRGTPSWLRDGGGLIPPPPPPPPKGRTPSGSQVSSTTAAEKSEGGKREDKETMLSAELIQYLKDRVGTDGGPVNGPTVASEFASRYNAWIRVDTKRNDGALRRWIGSRPGVSVENCGGNRWNVWLDLDVHPPPGQAAEEEEHGDWAWQEERRHGKGTWERRQGKGGGRGYNGGRSSWTLSGHGGGGGGGHGRSAKDNQAVGIGLWQ